MWDLMENTQPSLKLTLTWSCQLLMSCVCAKTLYTVHRHSNIDTHGIEFVRKRVVHWHWRSRLWIGLFYKMIYIQCHSRLWMRLFWKIISGDLTSESFCVWHSLDSIQCLFVINNPDKSWLMKEKWKLVYLGDFGQVWNKDLPNTSLTKAAIMKEKWKLSYFDNFCWVFSVQPIAWFRKIKIKHAFREQELS